MTNKHPDVDTGSLPSHNAPSTATSPGPAGQKSPSGPAYYLSREIHNYLTSLPILGCCFASGLIDAAVFNAWGVFACIQTGNTIILGLGAAQLPVNHKNAWLQTLIPIVFFFIGSFFANRTTRALGPLKRGTLGYSFFTQFAFILIAAAIIQTGRIPGIVGEGDYANDDGEPLLTLIPLAFLASQAGMQSVTSRQLGINEIPTTVLTSVYCDLGNDDDLFVPFTQNWKRNRRFGAAICILVGAIVGGWLSRTSEGMTGALWFACGIKAIICVAWLCWPVDPKKA